MKKNLIIGIAGTKGSGKDMCASMLRYIIRNGTASKFRDWAIREPNEHVGYPTDDVIHFADYIKDILSRLFNIERRHFDDRMYKDELWYCFNNGRFIDDHHVIKEGYFGIELIHLTQQPLSWLIGDHGKKCCIKLRTLMQYFGTDVVRKYLGPDVWVYDTMREATVIVDKYDYCLIPDVRFNNEAKILTHNFGGYVLKINRDVKTDNHLSEFIDLSGVDDVVTIDNNGTKMNTFYQLYKWYSEL